MTSPEEELLTTYRRLLIKHSQKRIYEVFRSTKLSIYYNILNETRDIIYVSPTQFLLITKVFSHVIFTVLKMLVPCI